MGPTVDLFMARGRRGSRGPHWLDDSYSPGEDEAEGTHFLGGGRAQAGSSLAETRREAARTNRSFG